MRKKLTSLILVLTMVVSMMAAMGITASAEDSGTWSWSKTNVTDATYTTGTGTNLPDAIVGEPYQVVFTCNEVNPNDFDILYEGSISTSIKLDGFDPTKGPTSLYPSKNTCVLQGIPTTAGTYTIICTCDSYTKTYTLNVKSKVTVATATNGTVSADKDSACKDETVTVTATPTDGYVLDTLTYTPENGTATDITKNGDGQYTFKMPENAVTVSATFEKAVCFIDADKDGTQDDGDKAFTTVQKAINAAGATPTNIVMISDTKEQCGAYSYSASGPIRISVDQNITLDLNNHVLEWIDDTTVIMNFGNLTITDSTDENEKTVRYFTDKKCSHGKTVGSYCTDCDNNKATLDGCYETYTTEKPSGTEGTDYIKVLGGCITGGVSTDCGGAIASEGNLTLEDGNIVGNLCTRNYDDGIGGGIYEYVGTLTMKGGNVVGNAAYGGGGVYVASCKFNMSGGTICYNAAQYGGGVYTECLESETQSEFIMCGNADISYNEAVNGGGVNISGYNGGENIIYGLFSMYEGEGVEGEPTISNNTTIDSGTNTGQGGGVCLSAAKMTSNCGKITDNSSVNSGGGIFVDENSSCSISGITITGNNACNSGGGICVGGDVNGCFIEGTKITMADGSVKNIEDVKNGDKVRTFDHDAGELSTEKVINKFVGNGTATAMMLHFESDTELGIVGAHGLLEKESLKYVALSSSNAKEYIGKYFYNADSAKWDKLESVTFTTKEYKYYALYSAHHINCIANNMLSATDDVLFYLNVFDMDENLKIDQVKKQQDIDKYGLTSYDDFSDVIDRESFDNFNTKYAHIARCKGLVTLEELLEIAANTMSEGEDNNATLQSEEGPVMTLFSKLSGTDEDSGLTLLGVGGEEETAPLTIGANVTIEGNTVNDKKNNVYLETGKYIKLDGVNNTTPIGVTLESGAGKFTTNGTTDDVKNFTSDSLAYKVKYNNTDGYLELAKYDISRVATNTAIITLEKATMTDAQAIAIAKSQKPYDNLSTSTSIAYAEADDFATTNKYKIISAKRDTDWTTATNMTLAEMKNGLGSGEYFVIGTVAKHSHNWSYSLSTKTSINDTIVATCTGPGTCDYTGSDTNLTITASNAQCDDTAHGATLSAKTIAGYTETDMPKINYAKKNGDNWDAATENVPKAAGTYKASITVGKSEDTKATAYVVYKILNTATNTDFTFTTPSNLTADGTVKKVTVTGKDGMGAITVYYSSDSGTTWSIEAPTTAGTYIVKIDVAEGTEYAAAKDITDSSWTFTISEPAPSPTPVTTYTITFDSNGAEGNMDAVNIEAGKEYTLPECGFTVPEGKQFAGWKIGDKIYHPGDKVTLTASSKLSAIWEDIPVEATTPYVVAKTVASGKTALAVSWTECEGASEYAVYANKCNTKGHRYSVKKIATTSKTSYTIKKLSGKKLVKNTFYKVKVVALDANGNKLATSKVMHAATGGYKGKYGNTTKITAKKSELAVSVGYTKTVGVKTYKIYKNKKTPATHAAKVRYLSSNKNVATVNSKGIVTGIKSGTCTIYMQAPNGLWATTEVIVLQNTRLIVSD